MQLTEPPIIATSNELVRTSIVFNLHSSTYVVNNCMTSRAKFSSGNTIRFLLRSMYVVDFEFKKLRFSPMSGEKDISRKISR